MGNSKSTKISTSGPARVKLLLVGKNRTGKTSLVTRHEHNEFSDQYTESTGCSLSYFPLFLEGQSCQLLVLDSLSEADFTLDCRLKSIGNANVVALVFDLSDESSWLDVPDRIEQLQLNGYKNNNLLLIGAKCDCKSVEDASIQQLVQQCPHYTIEYVETSAKYTQNIALVFERAFWLGINYKEFRWARIKALVYLYRYGHNADDYSGFSWANMCEAIPTALGMRKSGVSTIVNRLPPELFKQLLDYL